MELEKVKRKKYGKTILGSIAAMLRITNILRPDDLYRTKATACQFIIEATYHANVDTKICQWTILLRLGVGG